MNIILATRNVSKLEQIRAMFTGMAVKILTPKEAGVVGEPVEDGATLAENTFKKAAFVHQQTGEWSLADDTGLFIDALDGQPGINSARWAGPDATTEEILRFTLARLKNVPPENRGAVFRTVAALISPSSEIYYFTGEVAGSLLMEPRVASQPNMPYSSIFRPAGLFKVWAEMTVEEENEVSHRGIAFGKVRDFITARLSSPVVYDHGEADLL